jgi:hypothetical protein
MDATQARWNGKSTTTEQWPTGLSTTIHFNQYPSIPWSSLNVDTIRNIVKFPCIVRDMMNTTQEWV